MKKLITVAFVAIAVLTTGGCKAQKQYECIIKDAKTGEVIKKVKVVYKEECQAFAL